MNSFEEIQKLLVQKADLQARYNLLPYDGTPEVKEKNNQKYIYIRKRVNGRVTSTYVGPFDDILLTSLLKSTKEAREIRKQIRKLDKELALLGYIDNELNPRVQLNLDFARSNMKQIIYDQAILEGIATTFPDTEAIIENGKIHNVDAEGVQKILNLKHSWEFILDKNVIQSKCDYYLCSYIARLVNEGFYQDGGRIRGVPVTIGGSSYIPPLPMEFAVKEQIENIVNSSLCDEDKAIELCLYVMKTQIYNDGNKRTAVIFANFYLISRGKGLLIIPFDKVPQFKKELVGYYESTDIDRVKMFLRRCIVSF